MSWWRLHPRRSARWQAKRRLNARRTVRGRPWVSRQVRSLALRSDWKVVAAVSLLSSVPLAWFVGRHSEHWLDGAWVVSAVLVGLAIGLIVVLLQLAAGRNVRAEPTFRAVISSSGVMWPVAFSLVFVAWVGVIELTSGRHGPPAGIADYTLAYFIVGVILQAAVFIRTVRLAGPAGVGRVVRAVQADGTRRSVKERLTRQYANDIFLAAAESAGLAAALGGRGATVTIDEGGIIDDLDVRLPTRIAALGLQGSTAITARVGAVVERGSTGIASAAGTVPPWRSAMLRRAVHVRRRARGARDSLSIFREAVDLARQSMGEGVRPDVAIDLIMAGLEELLRVLPTSASGSSRLSMRFGRHPKRGSHSSENSFRGEPTASRRASPTPSRKNSAPCRKASHPRRSPRPRSLSSRIPSWRRSCGTTACASC
jgi:hypothetical protein